MEKALCGTGNRCPYCQTDCLTSEPVWPCPVCGTVHHNDCWDENNGCAMFGCSMATAAEKKDELEIPVSYWGRENKECPKCGKEILAAAVRCRFCGARFTSARPLDSREFEALESIKERHPGLKRAIILFFIGNILTVSAPFAAFFAFLWYRRNRAAVATLPSLFKFLIITGIYAGAGQTIAITIMGILYSFVRQGTT